MLAFADELFECVWPFLGVGALRVNFEKKLETEYYSTLLSRYISSQQ